MSMPSTRYINGVMEPLDIVHSIHCGQEEGLFLRGGKKTING